MFAIGDRLWPGVSKLVEELGELQQVLGKLMGSRGKTAHWSGDLSMMLVEEIADVLAAIQFVIEKNKLNKDTIMKRVNAKLATFHKWHEDTVCSGTITRRSEL